MADGDRRQPREVGPQPGPQTDFLACSTDVALYGGSAGGGKSHGLLLDVLNYAHTPGWHGLMLRRHRKDLMGAGGLYEKARALYQDTGAVFRAGGEYVDVRWPSGAMLAFRHLGAGNVYDYQGLEFAWVGIDEATHLELDWILYLMTRVRTTCGVRTAMRLTCNPDPDHPLREWVGPYLRSDGTADRSQSGRVRWFQRSVSTGKIVWGDSLAETARLAGRPSNEIKSFAFIPALVEDNPALLRENPNYVGNLAIAGAVEEEKLRRGNWDARPEGGGMLRRSRWGFVTQPIAPLFRWVRAWDKGASKPGSANPDPDFTIGILMAWDIHGRFYVLGMAACREEPPERDRLMERTAKADGARVTQVCKQSGGDAGKSDALHSRRLLAAGDGEVVTIRETQAKVVRAQPMALALERGHQGDAPRPVIELALDDRGVWSPVGFILDDGWLALPYSDKGANAPATLGALFWSQVAPFWDPNAAHDDVPDAMADAYAVGAAPPSRRVDPRKRARMIV